MFPKETLTIMISENKRSPLLLPLPLIIMIMIMKPIIIIIIEKRLMYFTYIQHPHSEGEHLKVYCIIP